MWRTMVLVLASSLTQTALSAATLNQPTPAPPFAQVVERQPYGVTIRLLLAPEGAAERLIQVRAEGARDVSWIVSNTSQPQVRMVQVFAPSSRTLSLRFQTAFDYSGETRRSLDRRESAYSQPIRVTTLPAFKQAPSAPADFSVAPASPFAFNLTWRDQALHEHSFEIERCCGTCQRIAVALPGSTSLRIGGFLPQSRASFRLRAVNSAGHSKWSALRAATTPPITSKLPPVLANESREPSACTTLEALEKQVAQENLDHSSFAAEDPIFLSLGQLGAGHKTVTIGNSTDCGTGGCPFRVYGETGGCLRLISEDGFREALELGDDWPILVARWHSSAGEYALLYSQMIDGRYQHVDVSRITGIESTWPSANSGLEFDFDGYGYCPGPKSREVSTERQ